MKSGTVHESNGDVYTGGFVENRRQGFGKCVYSNGDVYEGEWLNDLCHGQGTLTLATPSPTVSSSIQGSEIEHTLPPRPLDVEEKVDVLKSYEGEWKEGYFDGLGVAVYLDGTYRGEFVRGRRFGSGRREYADGAVYDGTFDGVRHGTGKLVEADGSVYAGSFVNDLFHGKGNFCIKAFRKVANAVAAIQRMQKLSGLWEGPGEDEFSEDVDSAEQLNAVVGSSFR